MAVHLTSNPIDICDTVSCFHGVAFFSVTSVTSTSKDLLLAEAGHS